MARHLSLPWKSAGSWLYRSDTWLQHAARLTDAGRRGSLAALGLFATLGAMLVGIRSAVVYFLLASASASARAACPAIIWSASRRRFSTRTIRNVTATAHSSPIVSRYIR
jgi:hypothetical protein